MVVWGGGEFTKAGVPDILACVNGYFLGIELKAPRGRPSDLQLYNLRQIDEAGGFGILLYPKDFQRFKEMVHQLNLGNDLQARSFYKEMKGW